MKTLVSLRCRPAFRLPLIAKSFLHTSSSSAAFGLKKPAPQWKVSAVSDNQFVELNNSQFLGKWLVLFFYPLDFTFVCPTEITAFSDNVDKFKALDCNLLGVSVDSKHSHLAWINTPRSKGGIAGLKIPLLSDINKTMARDYQVLDTKEGIAFRGTFIIDPKGILRQISVNDLGVGRSVDEVLRLVQAFQFSTLN